MAIGDLADDSSTCVHPLSYPRSPTNNSQMLPSGAELRLPLSDSVASTSENYSLNRYLPPSFHQQHQQLTQAASTPQSLQLSITNPLTTAHPSSATAQPAAGGHPEFKDEATGASSAFQGNASGGCRDEIDGAGGAIDSSETNGFLNTKPALEVIEMGFPSEVVKAVIHLKVVETGIDYTTAEALLDAVIAYQIAISDEDSQWIEESTDRNSQALDNVQQNISASDTTKQSNLAIRKKKKGKVKSSSNGTITATGDQQQINNESQRLHADGENVEGNTSASSQLMSPFLLKEENKKMKSSRLCKICQENEIQIVFLPCGHLVCCSECSSLVLSCTVCHRAVKGSVKFFLA